jgi:tetratricopeptide (TPR) repeat protein
MSIRPTALILLATIFVACAGNPDKRTLKDLHRVEPDVAEVQVHDGLERAMVGYQQFLQEAPESAMTPEAMRRLADLKLEKEYGYLGKDGASTLPKPAAAETRRTASPSADSSGLAQDSETIGEFERRAAGAETLVPSTVGPDMELPVDATAATSGPLEAIALYDRILETYPDYPFNDWVLYQKARAMDELGRTDEAIAVIERLLGAYPSSRYSDEVQFRRAEYFFTRKRFFDAETAYSAITARGPGSEYYELALYKLGWSLYKQEMHEEALDQYIALLDYKVDSGYDFDQVHDESEERRIADTFRVISLSFSSLGGPESIESYFVSHGARSYEDRIYSQLGEFYLEKLRYSDAAIVHQAFVDRHPLHKASPRFSMRVVQIYEAGGFPILVLESKKEFAARYGFSSGYWTHFDRTQSPEVVADLKRNLEDLANHYHALYQEAEHVDAKPQNYAEALEWYRAFLVSFPLDPETPAIHYRMADLLLEDGAYGDAAQEYERTAYDYPPHDRSAQAGYAAIFAHREHEKLASGEGRGVITRLAVASTLRFVDAFPSHEHAAVVLGTAADDLYDMKELERAIVTATRLIESYPDASLEIRRAAWAVNANSAFDLGRFEPAEQAFAKVLELTPVADESRQAVVDSLAASIYKQGELASVAGNDRLAADHFLRIAKVAPSSEIRPVAEYDAGAALMRLEDWTSAATVLEEYRVAHPTHALQADATKQVARVYREQGDDARAADEYERVAAEATDPELRRDAMLLAGELHEKALAWDRALAVYQRYVAEYAEPLEVAVETRFKIAGLHARAQDEKSRHAALREIVRIDASAGTARTPRIRYLAARSALVLAEGVYERFRSVALVQPFDRSLKQKQERMDAALRAFEALVDYEAAEVTAAATFYIAETYSHFSRSLMESERPEGLSAGELDEYELVLEEEAFPFEERAIDVHEKNLELLSIGVFNPWIEKSLEQLAVLMPGRYAKFEESSGLIVSIERYAYNAPNTLPGAVAEAVIETVVEAESVVETEAEAVVDIEVEAMVETEAVAEVENQSVAPAVEPATQAETTVAAETGVAPATTVTESIEQPLTVAPTATDESPPAAAAASDEPASSATAAADEPASAAPVVDEEPVPAVPAEVDEAVPAAPAEADEPVPAALEDPGQAALSEPVQHLAVR